MRCPVHKDYWLFENAMETEGWCVHCDKWYKLEPTNPVRISKLKEGENGN